MLETSPRDQLQGVLLLQALSSRGGQAQPEEDNKGHDRSSDHPYTCLLLPVGKNGPSVGMICDSWIAFRP